MTHDRHQPTDSGLDSDTGPEPEANTNPETESGHDLTLDPENWETVRALGHRMVDDMIDYLASVRERPAWQPMPQPHQEALENDPVPYQGQPLEQVYETFKQHILPFPTGNLHPRFFGWVMGNGTATAMLADMLAAGMNPHMAGYDQSASRVERQVVRWLAELVGFPEQSSGLLVSGGTMANLNALAVARQTKAGFNLRQEGLQGADKPHLTVYGSSETHGWIYKACELMGLGRDAFRAIAVDTDYRIDVDRCRRAIQEDLDAGYQPFCLIATVGTVNTGAIDDVAALRQLADEFDLWLHIDGAFGALVALTPNRKSLVSAQHKADSIALDLHKWGYLPFEAACVLIRDGHGQTQTFTQPAAYLAATRRGPAVGMTYFADRGLQLSRGFKALKVWMSFKEYGIQHIGRLIEQNIHQAQYLAQRVDQHPQLQRLAPVSLNIVCFRYRPNLEPAPTNTTNPPGADQHHAYNRTHNIGLNQLNHEILLRIQESGIAVPSQTLLDGNFALRVCITNHRTRTEDLDVLVNAVVELGDAVLGDAALGGI